MLEVKEVAKITYDVVLFEHIINMGRQLARLPNENVKENINFPVGQTYEDIVRSYCDMVEHFEGLLAPYLDSEYVAIEIATPDIKQAKKKFAELIKVCARRGFLLTKVAKNVSVEDSYALGRVEE